MGIALNSKPESKAGVLEETNQQEDVWLALVGNLLKFVFPPGLNHPSSGPRLYAWAQHGPAVEASTLSSKCFRLLPPRISARSQVVVERPADTFLTFKAGKSTRPMLEHEMRLVIDEVESQFAVDLMHLRPKLDLGDRGWVKAADDDEVPKALRTPACRQALTYSMKEVLDLLLSVRGVPAVSVSTIWDLAARISDEEAKMGTKMRQDAAGNATVPNNSSGAAIDPLSKTEGTTAAPSAPAVPVDGPSDRKGKGLWHLYWTILSNAILDDRQRRLRVISQAVVRPEDIRRDDDVLRWKTRHVYSRTTPKPYLLDDLNSPSTLQRCLHRNLFKVMPLTRGIPSSEFSLNARILRPDFEPRGDKTEGWDNYCCVRNAAPGTRLPKLQPGESKRLGQTI
eukprot:NODE_558_length_1354_cov_381.370115_g434_i0.p1 GENE.NODE_558_length_1354_cov_381.370115_g434_i0~~NODE_558_length_1354_cov_381.370115_g434_i0.p1  ORF type:complete len:396 (+),score=87.43 NODE_558_length_1354_cov_381.370115_g434_i0:34-1221(+)